VARRRPTQLLDCAALIVPLASYRYFTDRPPPFVSARGSACTTLPSATHHTAVSHQPSRSCTSLVLLPRLPRSAAKSPDPRGRPELVAQPHTREGIDDDARSPARWRGAHPRRAPSCGRTCLCWPLGATGAGVSCSGAEAFNLSGWKEARESLPVPLAWLLESWSWTWLPGTASPGLQGWNGLSSSSPGFGCYETRRQRLNLLPLTSLTTNIRTSTK
jgi:hypothetical protein